VGFVPFNPLDVVHLRHNVNACVINALNKKFELMLTRRAKVYSSSGSIVWLKIGVFTLS